jgi:hypothetical protein
MAESRSIKLVLPISEVDRSLAELLVPRLCKLGGLKNTPILVMVCWADSFNIDNICHYMRPFVKEVSLVVLPDVPEALGWPAASNHMFYETAKHLDEVKNEHPFYWFEMDCFPITSDWLETIEKEYKESARPYLGVVNESLWRDNGTGETFIRGKHMVGSGIYPANFIQRCDAIHYLEADVAWDVACGPEIVDQCTPTKLIAHRWNTCNYKRNHAGEVVGEDKDFVEGRRHYNQPIPYGTRVVHGCKDKSLYEIEW